MYDYTGLSCIKKKKEGNTKETSCITFRKRVHLGRKAPPLRKGKEVIDFLLGSHVCSPSRWQVDKKLQGGFVLEFEDRLVDLSTAKKQSEFSQMVAKLEADLM